MKNGKTLFRHAWLLGSALTALAGCASTPDSTPHASLAQTTYATPDQAVTALVTASRKDDRQGLLKILGPQSEKLVYSGDAVADRDSQKKFTAAYDASHSLEAEGADKEILVVGPEQWPMPIPLVRTDAGWVFDAAAGEQAVLDRRIGHNELAVIEVCREYVEAQNEYADIHKQTRGTQEYAQHITSKPGTHDGLYWPAAHGKPQSPFGPLLAEAQAEGYSKFSGHRAPYHGYYFRVLKHQGPAAAGGEKDYIAGGHMTRGFALIAYPAMYGDSGVKSFIVNQNGIVYEKDLGSNTPAVAAQIRAYNPDEDWQAVR